MKDTEEKKQIQRILVALDASSHSLAGLEAAVALASKLDAEILGVYVEDINLLRLAEMPFASELGQYSSRPRKLDTGQLERQLRIHADRARQALLEAAEAADLAWSFRVVRGSIPVELIAATQDTDLIILGQRGWSNFVQVGSTTQTIMDQARKLTLILRSGNRLGKSVMAVFDGSPVGEEALSFAGSLAQERDGNLTVVLIAPDREKAQNLHQEVASWAERNRLPIAFRWLKGLDARMICYLAQTEGSGVLVVGRESPGLTEEALLAILIDIKCPVMVVRHPEIG
jgi:nucleotide-binding universal stress UspA family protein